MGRVVQVVSFCIVFRFVAEAGKPIGTQAPPNPVRYTLCSSSSAPPVAHRSGGETISVFAASVAGGRTTAGKPNPVIEGALALRAALLVESPRPMRLRMPSVNDRAKTAGHTKGVSYAKCFAGVLPNETSVGCRVGLGPDGRAFYANASFSEGKLWMFRNGELHHDFISCVLGNPAIAWRHRRGPPKRLFMQILFHMPKENAPYIVPLELCRVSQPWKSISFCSQPLYGFKALQQEVPSIMDDWLDYHLGHLGIEQADIYDVDGSAAESLVNTAKWGHAVRYLPNWPSSVSERMAATSRKYPYCAETWAYAHCLTTHRALSYWVVLLHAPDEYLVPGEVFPWARSKGSLPALIQKINEQHPHDEEAPTVLRVNAVSMARGGLEAIEAEDEGKQRAASLAVAQQRGEIVYPHTPIIDPFRCISAGPHVCYADRSTEAAGAVIDVNPRELVLHHYVEMLAKDRGRCSTQHHECVVPEKSASWIVALLRNGSS